MKPIILCLGEMLYNIGFHSYKYIGSAGDEARLYMCSRCFKAEVR